MKIIARLRKNIREVTNAKVDMSWIGAGVASEGSKLKKTLANRKAALNETLIEIEGRYKDVIRELELITEFTQLENIPLRKQELESIRKLIDKLQS